MKININHILIIVSIFTILFCTISVRSCQNNENQIKITNHNYKALQDSVRYYKTENGEIYGEKLAYISTIKDLENLNKDLYDNVNFLNNELKHKDQIIAGINETITVTDTITIINEVVLGWDENCLLDTCQSEFIIPFEDNILDANVHAKYQLYYTSEEIPPRKIEGTLIFTEMNYNVSIPIEVYITKEAKVLLKSKYENIHFNDVQAFIDPSILNKMKRKNMSLSLAFYTGYGINYNPFNKKISNGLQSGLGLTLGYKILEW